MPDNQTRVEGPGGSTSVRQTNQNHVLISTACDKRSGTPSSINRMSLRMGPDDGVSDFLLRLPQRDTVFSEAYVEL